MFDYTVAAGQNTAALAVTGNNLNGGTAITDGAGNAANLTGADGPLPTAVQIETTAPTVTAAADTASGERSDGRRHGGDHAHHERGGHRRPRHAALALNDGGTATYDAAHSTATSLVFDYTVAAGQNTAALAVTGNSQRRHAITDGAGNAANLTGANGPLPTAVQIETTAPTVTAVADTASGSDLTVGGTMAITLTMSEAVNVVGTPALALNDGGTATYDAAHSTATSLVFDYTVAAGQNTAALAVTGNNLNGSTIAITDGAGNAANLTGANGPLPTAVQVETTILVQGGEDRRARRRERSDGEFLRARWNAAT